MALRQPNAVCTVCGEPYWVAHYKLATSRFCSRACHGAGRGAGRIEKDELARLYYDQRLSMEQIANQLGCSPHKVVYWMDQYGFERRSWSEATYVNRNRDGDPFAIRMPETPEEKELFALAIGLYMGEGAKKGQRVILVNTNPAILRLFLVFLEQFCGVSRSKVKVWLNIFDDCDVDMAIRWWSNELNLNREQFYDTAARKSRGGSYTNKSKYGTLSVVFTNVKLKRIIDDWCSEYYEKFFTLK